MVNNAYGLQCTKIANDLTACFQKGRLDVLVSSTDKNFMVPVGGSLIYSPHKKAIVDKVNKNYPGRASGGPIQDLFITLLSMGELTFKQLLKQRKECYQMLKEGLQKFADKHGEKVLCIPNNKISLACTLSTF